MVSFSLGSWVGSHLKCQLFPSCGMPFWSKIIFWSDSCNVLDAWISVLHICWIFTWSWSLCICWRWQSAILSAGCGLTESIFMCWWGVGALWLNVSMLFTIVLLMYIYTACWLNNYVVQLCPLWCNSYGARLSRLLTSAGLMQLCVLHMWSWSLHQLEIDELCLLQHQACGWTLQWLLVTSQMLSCAAVKHIVHRPDYYYWIHQTIILI